MPADLEQKIEDAIDAFLSEAVATAPKDKSWDSVKRELARRIAALVPAAEWQPIETAPRDGTRVLGYGPEEDHDYYIETIRFWGGRWPIVFMHGYGEPTHWMPLPTPPGTPARRVYTGEDERLPCDVQVGSVKFKKGVKTKLVFDAIARRASEEE